MGLWSSASQAEAVDHILVRACNEPLLRLDVVGQHAQSVGRSDWNDAAHQPGLWKVFEGQSSVVDVDHRPRPKECVARNKPCIILGDFNPGIGTGRRRYSLCVGRTLKVGKRRKARGGKQSRNCDYSGHSIFQSGHLDFLGNNLSDKIAGAKLKLLSRRRLYTAEQGAYRVTRRTVVAFMRPAHQRYRALQR